MGCSGWPHWGLPAKEKNNNRLIFRNYSFLPCLSFAHSLRCSSLHIGILVYVWARLFNYLARQSQTRLASRGGKCVSRKKSLGQPEKASSDFVVASFPFPSSAHWRQFDPKARIPHIPLPSCSLRWDSIAPKLLLHHAPTKVETTGFKSRSIDHYENFKADSTKLFPQSALRELTFVFENLDLALAKVLLILAVVAQVDELAGVALVLVAVEQRLLVLRTQKCRNSKPICQDKSCQTLLSRKIYYFGRPEATSGRAKPQKREKVLPFGRWTKKLIENYCRRFLDDARWWGKKGKVWRLSDGYWARLPLWGRPRQERGCWLQK